MPVGKRPKYLNESNTTFVLYAPKRIKIEPGHAESVPMNFKIILLEHIILTYILLPYLAKQETKLMDYNTHNRTSINFFNQNFIKTVTIRKREPIANFITFNEGTENFNVNTKILKNQSRSIYENLQIQNEMHQQPNKKIEF